jgi:hypothetical protein
MKTILAIGTTLVYSTIFAFCNLPQNPDEYRQWERESLDAIKAQENAPPNEAIPKLGRWIKKLSGGANVETGERPVFHAAQSALLAIPGHAKYYQDQIERTRAFVKHYHGLSDEEQRKIEDQFREQQRDISKEANYEGVCGDAFDILGLLPSPETVAVLGHYLEDPEGRDGKNLLDDPIHLPGADVMARPPNCAEACIALGRLGIEHPPVPPGNMPDTLRYHERVDVWKQWWNEIKAGKRTYRFIGSPIEYGPDGPATPEQIEKARSTRERDEKRAAGHTRRTGSEEISEKADETKKPSSLLFTLIAATLALLVSIVWYFQRAKAAR